MVYWKSFGGQCGREGEGMDWRKKGEGEGCGLGSLMNGEEMVGRRERNWREELATRMEFHSTEWTTYIHTSEVGRGSLGHGRTGTGQGTAT